MTDHEPKPAPEEKEPAEGGRDTVEEAIEQEADVEDGGQTAD